MKVRIVFLFIIIGCFSLKGQVIKGFTHDSVKVIKELSDFFDNANKKDGKDFIENNFEKVWFKKPWSPNRRDFVYKSLNELLKKRLRPYPDFHNFLSAIISFYNNNLPEKTWSSWEAVFNQVLNDKSSKNISSFVEASYLLFDNSALARTNSLEWFVNSKDFIFELAEEPIVKFKNVDLQIAVKADTATIFATSGIYYIKSEKWIGTGGKVTWERTSLSKDIIFADIKNYEVNLRKQGYEADSAIFYNKEYFQKPILGKLTDRAVPDAKPETSSYPRFESYSKRFQIAGIAGNLVDYDGGFSMVGQRFVGSGNKGNDATISIKKGGKKFMVVSSKGFVFKKDKIFSDDAGVVMYLEKDSIVHPSLKFNFNLKTKELNLIRVYEGISKTPYFNTFHNVDMHIEEIQWKIDSAYMNLKTLMGTTQGIGVFESNSYYRKDRYDELQMMDQLNPLTVVKDFSRKNNNIKEFYGADLAKYMKYELHDVAPLLVRLSAGGYIMYDVQDDWVVVKDKLFDYTFARAGMKDYDVLSIGSNVRGGTNNAVMNLLNYDLKIYGVQSIFLSDSQNVYIYPEKGMVVLKKDRNFDFAGNVNAGLFSFYGKKFSFEYDKFKINLDNVDSLRLSVKEKHPNGQDKIVQVKTVIENINGELFIDNMGNRSGIKSKDYPNYPIFKSNKDAFVFYEKRSIQRGAYKKDNFYFKLDPFEIDSLDNFSPKGLKLDGDFVSAGIFPEFREKLTIQPDYSLGFVRETPSEGFAVYGTKGKYFAKIKLSHKGLQGEGKLTYLTSVAESKDILFYPDSLNANAENWTVAEQPKGSKVEYPPVKGDTVYIHWMPKKDIMNVQNLQKPFDMYAGNLKLTGRIDYTPSLMSGRGKSEFAGAEMTSEKYKFKNKKFTSDTANFRLKNLDEGVFAFSTVNVNAIVDFEKREAAFKSNGKGSIVTFDVNKYICYMEEFKWLMDQNAVEVTGSNKKQGGPGDLNLTGPEFISIHPKQDSLRFFAPKARFDLKKYIISAKEVQFINVADARVYPDSGNVTVLKDAVIKQLNNAKIVANSVTKYHTLHSATVNIFARKSYSASGKYDYVDELKSKQTIFFSNISVDTTYQTYGDAMIPDTSNFTLSPNYSYNGKVYLRASDQFLTFDGQCMIQHACSSITRNWFSFKSQIDPLNIYIPITASPTDNNGTALAASLMSTTTMGDSNQFYTAFLSKKISKSDVEVIPTTGYLYFDKANREYKIAEKEKLVEQSLPGNYLSLNANKCIVYGEGKLNLGADLGQVKLTTVGNGTHILVRDSAFFDLMILSDFFFDNSALDKMADIFVAATSLPSMNFGKPVYEKGLKEILGKEKADKMISEMNLYGKSKKFPDELEKSLFITELNMRWDPTTKSYISIGKIGIGNIRKTQVNKMVDGYVQLKRKRSGDELNIYFEIDSQTWFFFSYSNGIMKFVSSKEEINNIIKELKAEKRTLEVEKGQKPYQFILGSETIKTLFLKKIKQATVNDD